MRIIHISTVHPPDDNRIYYKCYRHLSKTKHDVELWVKQSTSSNLAIDDTAINFFKVKGENLPSRLARAVETLWRCFKNRKSVFHFHDPELIPFFIIVRIFTKKIIYDVHEDNLLALEVKTYLPKFIRSMLYYPVWFFEKLASVLFYMVVAERAYLKRFPNAVEVLNYFDSSQWGEGVPHPQFNRKKALVDKDYKQLLYTGSLTDARGLKIYLDLLEQCDWIALTLVGRANQATMDRLLKLQRKYPDRLHLKVSVEGTPFEEIVEIYQQRDWDVGLAIFPPSPHYEEKELTKFFEYAFFGIPIVASNFKYWREVVEGNRLGVCVDPTSIEAIRAILKKDIIGNGMSEYADRHNWLSQIDNLTELYEYIESQ